MEEKQSEVSINGNPIPPSDYEIKNGVITFLKPLIELSPNPEINEDGKPVFQISVKYNIERLWQMTPA
jgi:hypothetical protein